MLAVCPEARLIDISHSIPPFDVRAGGFVLWAGSRDFPPGTVHLAVIDPGVGSDRRPLALEVGGSFFVGPDNGLFTPWLPGEAAIELTAAEYRLPQTSATFHGRDVFAPAAGRLAGGTPLTSLGRPIEDLVALPDPFGPVILWVDNFGNLVTNLEPPIGSLSVGGRSVPGPLRTFADARRGEPFWYVGSLGLVEIGVREGRADELLEAGSGTSLVVRREP